MTIEDRIFYDPALRVGHQWAYARPGGRPAGGLSQTAIEALLRSAEGLSCRDAAAIVANAKLQAAGVPA